MGRSSIRSDKKHRPQTFALADEHMLFIELYGEDMYVVTGTGWRCDNCLATG